MMAWIIGGVVANLLPAYSSIVGFVVGAVIYYVLAKYWWFKKYKQAEMEDPSDERYLGITVGGDWDIALDNEMAVGLEVIDEKN
jgi:NCS1 family nucleobase:cation symporter-1